MQCKCKNTMRCYDDICYTGARIDFMVCDNCGTKANVIYNYNDTKVNRVEWIMNTLYMTEESIVDEYLQPGANRERLLREYRLHGKLIVAYDFDNTVFDYHMNGGTYDNIINLLNRCHKLGFYLIVFTCNHESKYEQIANYLNKSNIPYSSINENCPDIDFAHNKIYYNILLDDRAGLISAYEDLKYVVEIAEKEKMEEQNYD